MTNTQEIERKLIGSLLSDKIHRDFIFDLTKQEYFYNLGHIYKEMRNQYVERSFFDAETIEAEIEGIGSLLQDCEFSAVYDEHTIEGYCNHIRNAYERRRIIKGLTETLQVSEKVSVSELHARISELTHIEAAENKSSLTPSHILEREGSAPKKEFLRTGVKAIDDFYADCGLHRGDVHTIIADSGHGKTQLSLMFESMLSNNYKGLHFQLEDYDVNTAKHFLTVNPEFADNIYVNDRISDIDEMKSEARRLKQTVGLDFVVIDYMQIVRVSLSDSKTLQLEYATDVVKQIAKDLNCVVFVTSQVSISGERYKWQRFPRADDAKWAKAIKEMSHCMTSLFRPNAIESLVVNSLGNRYIKNWNDEQEPYDSVFIRKVKKRRGQADHNFLHLIQTQNKGLQPYQRGF